MDESQEVEEAALKAERIRERRARAGIEVPPATDPPAESPTEPATKPADELLE